jgi:hypothetical protein
MQDLDSELDAGDLYILPEEPLRKCPNLFNPKYVTSFAIIFLVFLSPLCTVQSGIVPSCYLAFPRNFIAIQAYGINVSLCAQEIHVKLITGVS